MKLALLSVAAVIVLGSVSGCGDGSDIGANDVAKAADATRSAGTARTAITVKSAVLRSGQNLSFVGGGVLDLRSRKVRLHAVMSGLPALDRTGGAQLDEILDAAVIYVRSPLFARIPQASGKWLRFDLQSAQRLGFDFSQLVNSSASDPTQALSYLKAASGSVRKVGTETIRGQATTHYRATVDVDKYVDVVPADQRAAARQNIERVKKLTGLEQIPEDVWIDAHQHVRRVHVVETLKPTSGPLAHKQQRIDLTEELYDFGVPVSITRPPASDTVDISKLLPSRG